MHVQGAASASASAGAGSAQAAAWVGRPGSHGPKPKHHSGGPKASGGPKTSGGPKGGNGLHLGQIKKLLGQIAQAAQNSQAAEAGNGQATAPSSSTVDLAALQNLTGRLADVMDRLGTLTDLVTQATTAATSGGASTTGTTSTSSGTAGAGGTGATGGTATTSSASTVNQINLIYPFQGPTDFGSITINGVTTEFGIIDATGGLSARQVTGSLVNIINSDPDQTVTAQQRDNKILLVSKEAGATITVDDISFGTMDGTTGGFAGFLDGMSGSGTLMSNPISPILH